MPTRIFWVKLLLVDEFCQHFAGMTPEQRAKDIERSITAILTQSPDDSFGGKMLQKANTIYSHRHEVNTVNGSAGGRPRKNPLQEGRFGNARPSKDDVYDFAKASGLDGADAREWFEMNFVDRPGCDKDGVEIKNWKGHCRAYCKSMAEKRSQKQRRNAKPKAVPEAEAEDDGGCIDDGTLPF